MGKINIIVDLTRIGCQDGGTLLVRLLCVWLKSFMYMMIICTIKY